MNMILTQQMCEQNRPTRGVSSTFSHSAPWWWRESSPRRRRVHRTQWGMVWPGTISHDRSTYSWRIELSWCRISTLLVLSTRQSVFLSAVDKGRPCSPDWWTADPASLAEWGNDRYCACKEIKQSTCELSDFFAPKQIGRYVRTNNLVGVVCGLYTWTSHWWSALPLHWITRRVFVWTR